MALMLAEEKANCALIDVNAEKLEETRAAVMDYPMNLYCEQSFMTKKIKNISIYWMLASELLHSYQML